jgi:hypothetical protein
MAAMAVVSGNTTASNRSMGQPLNRGTASLQYLDEMSMAYSASDNDCTLESATPGGSTRRSDARRSRPLSSSFDGRQRHGYATAHVEHNIIRQKWPSDSWNVVDQPVAPPERLAATATNRKLQATEVGEKPISLDAVDDDFTMSVTTATTPLASPPPPFRHHLLFPPLGFDGITTEADDVNTGGKHRSNVAVYAEVRIGEEGPAAATAARMNSDCGDVQLQQLGLSTAATPHADAGDDDVVMQHRFNAVDDQSDNIRESSVSSSTERSMECRLNLSLEDVRTGCKPAIAAVAPPVGLGIVRSSEWMSVSDTSAGTAAVGCSNDSFDSTAVRAQESPMSSMPTAFTSTPVGVRCSIRQVEPPRRLSISADGGSSRHAIRPAAAEFENRNFSDAGDTPVNESQCPAALQLYQLAAGASAPVSFATGGGSRNPASRKLIYDIERVMAAPVTGTGTRKQQLPASCQRRQRRMRDGSSCAAVAATEFRHMSVVLPPSSSSYLSDSSSSSSSASSPSVSPYKEVNRRTLRTAGLTAVPPIPPITSGARRRRGHRTAAAPSQPKDMRSVRSDLASGRRLVFSQQRDSSTDHQTWDEYQVSKCCVCVCVCVACVEDYGDNLITR